MSITKQAQQNQFQKDHTNQVKLMAWLPTLLMINSKPFRIKVENFEKQFESDQQKIIQWRSQTNAAIFKAWKGEKIGLNKSHLIFQLPLLTLTQMKPIKIKNLLYIMKTLLLTFDILVKKFGYFKVTQKTIGISASKSIKMWINQNYQNNFASQEYTFDGEEKMIQDLIQICKEMTKNGSGQFTIEEYFFYLLEKQRCWVSFIQLFDYLWRFGLEYKITIPNQFQDVNGEQFDKCQKLQGKLQKVQQIGHIKQVDEQNNQNVSQKNQDRPKSFLANSKNKSQTTATSLLRSIISKNLKVSLLDQCPQEQNQRIITTSTSHNQLQKNQQSRQLQLPKHDKVDYLPKKYSQNNIRKCSIQNQVLVIDVDKQNKQKMKLHIKKVIKRNRKNKVIKDLKSIREIKSIEEINQNQIVDSRENDAQNYNKCELLTLMTRKIVTSTNQIDIAKNKIN